MSIIKELYKEVHQGKGKIFLLFLLCSFLAWAVSKFSETYESRTSFAIEFYNLPDTLLLNQESITSISAKVRTSGFRFLGYAVRPKTLKVNLEEVLQDQQGYFLTANTLKNQVEPQVPNSVALLELMEPIYFVDLYAVAVKKVPVKAALGLQLVPNYILKGKLEIQPDSVEIKGPKLLLDKIAQLSTESLQLDGVSEDFTRNLSIQPPDSLQNVILSTQQVAVKGTVVRFSEKEFIVTVTALNTPPGYRLRVFPNQVTLVCKAGIELLKEIKSTDFQVVVDYAALENKDSKRLYLELERIPEDIFSVRLLPDEVEFVLEKL